MSLLQPVAAAAATATAARTSETFQDIVNIAATAEALATTFYYRSLHYPHLLPNVNSTANRNYFQAALTQEAEHLMYLETLGAKPLATKFYFPDDMFSKESVFFPTASLLEDYFISAYIAAAIEFSGAVSSGITTANPFAIGVAVQIMGIECEHRALLRVAANLNPPNDRIAEKALLTSVSEAATPLAPFLGGGAGFSGPYSMPGPHSINETASPYGFAFFPKPVYV